MTVKQASQDQKDKKTASCPKKRVYKLERHEAARKARQNPKHVGNVIENICKRAHRVGRLDETIPPGGCFTMVGKPGFIWHAAGKRKRTPHEQHHQGVCDAGDCNHEAASKMHARLDIDRKL